MVSKIVKGFALGMLIGIMSACASQSTQTVEAKNSTDCQKSIAGFAPPSLSPPLTPVADVARRPVTKR
jgi:hypothetical protein